MRIKLLQNFASPGATGNAGQILAVEDELAAALLDGSAAVEVDARGNQIAARKGKATAKPAEAAKATTKG